MNGSNPNWSYGTRDNRYRHSSQWNSDRQANTRNDSAISKMQHQYWVTKETVFRKLGKKEDEYIVASDAELDAKLELFRSIQESCLDLQRIIDKYQERLCFLAQEENSLGRFLKESGKHDKTGAGSMMQSVGKTMSHSGQQRIALRVPLLRLFQEVETFRHRAIEDTIKTVQAMEKSRTEYRASLSWMKDISQELDPDTYKQLEKFRKVQDQVKLSKSRFDRYKLDCLQKIDLLAAARCNMFSHALITYHNTMLEFATKSSQAFTSVAESFTKHQHFEFNVVKELSELTPENNQNPPQQEHDDKLLNFEELDIDGGGGVGEQGGVGGGLAPEATPNTNMLVDTEDTSAQPQSNQYLPSQLLMHNLPQSPGMDLKSVTSSNPNDILKPSSLKTSWLELFSELDPLANPDCIGETAGEPQRNC